MGRRHRPVSSHSQSSQPPDEPYRPKKRCKKQCILWVLLGGAFIAGGIHGATVPTCQAYNQDWCDPRSPFYSEPTVDRNAGFTAIGVGSGLVVLGVLSRK